MILLLLLPRTNAQQWYQVGGGGGGSRGILHCPDTVAAWDQHPCCCCCTTRLHYAGTPIHACNTNTTLIMASQGHNICSTHPTLHYNWSLKLSKLTHTANIGVHRLMTWQRGLNYLTHDCFINLQSKDTNEMILPVCVNCLIHLNVTWWIINCRVEVNYRSSQYLLATAYYLAEPLIHPHSTVVQYDLRFKAGCRRGLSHTQRLWAKYYNDKYIRVFYLDKIIRYQKHVIFCWIISNLYCMSNTQ